MSLCLARKVVRQEHFFQEQLQRRSFFRYRPVDLNNTSLLLCKDLHWKLRTYSRRSFCFTFVKLLGIKCFMYPQNVIMVKALVLWSPYALGTRTLLWFGHGCASYRMLGNTNVRNGGTVYKPLAITILAYYYHLQFIITNATTATTILNCYD